MVKSKSLVRDTNNLLYYIHIVIKSRTFLILNDLLAALAKKDFGSIIADTIEDRGQCPLIRSVRRLESLYKTMRNMFQFFN